MNTLKTLLAATAGFIFSATAFNASAEVFTIDGITYDGDGTNATIIGYTDALPAHVVIPEGVRADDSHNYYVTKVNENVFAGCEVMTSLTFGRTKSTSAYMTLTIGNNAFAAPNLQTVTVMRYNLPIVEGDPFTDAIYAQATLDIWKSLPEAQQEAYRTTQPWSRFSEKQIVTGLNSIADDAAADISVTTGTGSISVECPDNIRVEIYTVNGTMLYSGARGTRSVPSGIYIVKAGDSIFKVAV